ncbi:MAG: host attachment protein [Candidatus Macondimonas sp.]
MDRNKRKVWVVVADASRARLFRAETPRGPLVELEDAVHSAARLQDQELLSDRAGRAFDSQGKHRHGMEAPTDPHDQEAQRFAHELAERLHVHHNAHDFDGLVLVAPPRFLGLLRGALDEQVAKQVLASFDRDLTRIHTAAEVQSHLPDPIYTAI